MSDDEQVRRLLADARHTDPMPSDVAGRMDRVLADLRADRPVPAPVADLAAARRRRRVRTLLAAAAVVVVAGVGIDQLRGLGTGADDGAGSSSADSASSQEGSAGGDSAPLAGQSPQDFSEAVRLDPDRFAQQVRGLRADASLRTTEDGAEADGQRNDGDSLAAQPQAQGCTAPGRGRVVAVRYDGSPGLLVYRPVRGDTQVVDLYLCGRPGAYRSITLPAP
ncbi:hypothetical protein [Nocardioides sp.]|uniref:hypothetical protein n=1 Tax=Nocardioides sp. TaxID=35761 RepID=UPI0037834349